MQDGDVPAYVPTFVDPSMSGSGCAKICLRAGEHDGIVEARKAYELSLSVRPGEERLRRGRQARKSAKGGQGGPAAGFCR